MSFRSLTEALTLYRSETLTLDQAARRAGVPEAKLRTALRARGIPIRDERNAT